MADKTQWEYKVVSVGGFLGTPDAAIEAKLNELGQDGWEVFGVRQLRQGAGPISLLAKRPLDAAGRRRREREALIADS